MTLCKGCPTYHLTLGKCTVEDIDEGYYYVKIPQYKTRKYDKKYKDIILFATEDERKQKLKEWLPAVDPDALLYGKYEQIRTINYYFELVDMFLEKKKSAYNGFAKDTLHKIASIDEKHISRFSSVANKMTDMGDYINALEIIYEYELNDGLGNVLKKSIERTKSTDNVKKIGATLAKSHIELLPQYNDFIRSYRCEDEKINSFFDDLLKELDSCENKKRWANYISEIKNTLDERKIRVLLHFTRMENVPSILQNGIVPRNYHDSKGIKALYNDDSDLKATSLSIEFPNYLMLHTKNKYKYAIVMIDASVLADENVVCSLAAPFQLGKPFTFFSSNSKSNGGRYRVETLEEMFRKSVVSKKNDHIIERDSLKIPSNYTTDPQAEICAYVTIPPQYIQKILFPTDGKRVEYIEKYGKSQCVPFEVDYKLFYDRIDSLIWYNEGGYGNGK